jgi:hypothetical protein
MIPFAFAFVFLVASGIELLVERKLLKQFRIKKRVFIKGRLPSFFAFFGVTLYTFILSTLASPFKCTKQKDGHYFMAAYPSEPCYEGNWTSNLPFVVLLMVVYVILFPCWLAWILFRYGREQGLDSLWFTSRYGLLTRPYRRKMYFWELVNLLRRAVMVVATSFWQASSSSYESRLMIALVFLFVFLWLDVFVSPYIRGTRFVAST